MTQRRKTSMTLPKIGASQGAVCLQYVRCGRDGCRCADGDKQNLHGPYHYLFWRDRGRLRKRYVKVAVVPLVQAACDGRRQRERNDQQAVAEHMANWRTMRDVTRSLETLHSQKVHSEKNRGENERE